MVDSMGTNVVLGAGPLGTRLAEKLRAEGESVSLYSVMDNPAYDMPGTHPDAISGRDPDQVSQACQGAEVVYLCLNAHYVDWYEGFPPVLEGALRAAEAVGARFVYADNVYMYGDARQPLTEDLPHTDKPKKGMLRGKMADSVLAAHAAGRLKAVIGRAADMYGPGALNSSFGSTFGQRIFYPALQGQTVNILGDIDAPHSYIFVDDFASGLIELASQERAFGEVWHLPAAPAISHRELATLVFELAGQRPAIRGSQASGFFLRLVGLFQEDVGEVAEMLYQYEQPFIVDHGKYEAAFGASSTPHPEAIKATLEWYRARPV